MKLLLKIIIKGCRSNKFELNMIYFHSKNFYLLFSLFLLLLLTCSDRIYSDALMELEAGKFSDLEKRINESVSKKESEQTVYYQALNSFYQGDLKKAETYLSNISSQTYVDTAWLKNYLAGVVMIREKMEKVESDHFVLRVSQQEKFLANYALETLEKAYIEIGNELQIYPDSKIQVEIYPTQPEFSYASTLSKEILDRSGAIGICKFRRLMILSPGQLAFGYRWLDTLSHEYIHYLVNKLSGGQCPLWLNEGIAKFLDTRWRLREPQYWTPGNRTELVQAMKENRLIPFNRMEPSMVYLDNQTQVRQAFSQVAHAVHYIQKLKGSNGIRQILEKFSEGSSRQESFQKILGLSADDFEKEWTKFLSAENLTESPGAAVDKIKIDKTADELEEFVSTGIREHIRLGDRMRQHGHLQVALIQYEKALKQEESNPVALTKSARVLLALKQNEKAVQQLEKCVQENPNYASAYLLLGVQKILEQKWEPALTDYLEANAINPFNPEVHRQLSEIYHRLGDESKSKSEQEIFEHLVKMQ